MNAHLGLRGFSRLLILGALASLLSAAAVQAGQTRYYYGASGQLLGAYEGHGSDRSSASDAAGNMTYLRVFPTIPPTAVDTLGQQGILLADQTLTSQDGRFRLVVQEDGNLVVYEGGSSFIWNTGTQAQVAYLTLGTDGNLQLQGPGDVLVWQSNTPGHPNANLVMQSDGNLVLSSGGVVYWSTGTGGH